MAISSLTARVLVKFKNRKTNIIVFTTIESALAGRVGITWQIVSQPDHPMAPTPCRMPTAWWGRGPFRHDSDDVSQKIQLCYARPTGTLYGIQGCTVLYTRLHCIQGCSVYKVAPYTRLHRIQGCIVYKVALYCIQGCSVYKVSSYTRLHCIQGCTALYTRLHCIQSCTVQYTRCTV